MIKPNKIKAGIIGACIIASTMNISYADESIVRVYTNPAKDAIVDSVIIQTGNDTPVSSDDLELLSTQQININDEMLQKQKEIDNYLSEYNREAIAQKGFSVTHTAPFDTYVEIGITPYSDENADYLYEVFGKDVVKVVEGQQAYTMEISTVASETPDLNKSSKLSLFFSSILEWIRNLF